jgi:hypothetical protein
MDVWELNPEGTELLWLKVSVTWWGAEGLHDWGRWAECFIFKLYPGICLKKLFESTDWKQITCRDWVLSARDKKMNKNYVIITED